MFLNLSWDWVGFFLLLAAVFFLILAIKSLKNKINSLGVISIICTVFFLICSFLNFSNYYRPKFENFNPDGKTKMEYRLDEGKEKAEEKIAEAEAKKAAENAGKADQAKE